MTAIDDQARYKAGLKNATENDNRRFFEQSPVACLLVNREGTIVNFNSRAADLLMIDPELRSRPELPGYISQADQNNLASHINKVLTEKNQQTLDLRIQLSNGQELPARLVSSPMDDNPDMCLSVLVEMDNQPGKVRILSHLAYYDQLTGLPNRLLFNDRLRWAIRDARRRGERLAVMVVDLDNFKTVNDSLGHEAGDQVLKTVSARMLLCLRESDTLSRIGGDEFTVLMQHVTDTQDAEIAAGRLLEAIRQPNDIMDRSIAVSGSIGICLYPDDGEDADSLVRNADIAMYRSKTSGRNQMAFFNESMSDAVNRKSDLEKRLREAVKASRLNLYYQPIIDSEKRRIIGLEALLRWDSGNEGILPAGQFLRMAERLGLCHEFSDWALQAACHQLEKWIESGLINLENGFRLSVNLCAEQLTDTGLPARIASVLAESGLPAKALALDLAEEVVRRGDPQSFSNMKILHDMGVALHLDDFSQGFASLQKASGIPFSCLKIDQAMSELLMDNPIGEALLDALVGLAHTLGLLVIVEGVESEKAGTWFRDHGCDSLQGYCFCRPLPAVQMEMLLEIRPT